MARNVIGAGAGTRLSAKFVEWGGIDLLIIYNSGHYRVSNGAAQSEATLR